MDLLSSSQISEWEAYDRMDPIGTWRGDFRMAFLTCSIYNIVNHLYAKKGVTPKVLVPEDFMPRWDETEEEREERQKQSVEEMKGTLLSIAAVQNKKEERKLHQNPPRTVRKKK